MRAVFADAGYWVAVASSRDRLHGTAAAVAEGLGECRILTSEMVLVEVLNGFAECGVYLRTKAAELVLAVIADPTSKRSRRQPSCFGTRWRFIENGRTRAGV